MQYNTIQYKTLQYNTLHYITHIHTYIHTYIYISLNIHAYIKYDHINVATTYSSVCICIHEHFLIGQFNCQYCISRLHLTPQCRYKVSRCKSYIMTNSFSEFSAFQVQINPDAKCMLAHVINTNKVIIVRMPLRNPTRYLGVSGS